MNQELAERIVNRLVEAMEERIATHAESYESSLRSMVSEVKATLDEAAN